MHIVFVLAGNCRVLEVIWPERNLARQCSTPVSGRQHAGPVAEEGTKAVGSGASGQRYE
jgi:hypothetical protein